MRKDLLKIRKNKIKIKQLQSGTLWKYNELVLFAQPNCAQRSHFEVGTALKKNACRENHQRKTKRDIDRIFCLFAMKIPSASHFVFNIDSISSITVT